MNYTSELYSWINSILLIIAILLLPVGLGFCVFPKKMFNMANRMNKWITTDHIFSALNKPRYKESFCYRHHQIFGTVIILATLVSLYLLTFYTGIDSVLNVILQLAESEYEKWLFVIFYYLLLGANSLAVVFGFFMFIRPSALKSFEKLSNQWIDIDEQLKVLDTQKDLPDRLLPGNPRIFGFCVLLAAIYIIWCTYP